LGWLSDVARQHGLNPAEATINDLPPGRYEERNVSAVNLSGLAKELGLDEDASEAEVIVKLKEERHKARVERKDLMKRVEALESQRGGSGSGSRRMSETHREDSRPGTYGNEYLSRIDRVMASERCNFLQASARVAQDDPELHNNWLAETYTAEGQARAARIQASEQAVGYSGPKFPKPGNTANEKITRAAEAVARERSISFSAALAQVCKDRPDLYLAYERERQNAVPPIPGIPLGPGEEIV
jgi:hypothetical protein